MKIVENFFDAALRISPKTPNIISEVTGKLFYYVCLLELTLWTCSYFGYPISSDIFSSGTLNKFFNEYYIILLTFVLVTINLLIIFLEYLVSKVILWSLSVWIIYRQEYGLISVFDFRSKQEKVDFLKIRSDKLFKEISEGATRSEAQKYASSVLAFIAKLSIAILLVYSLIFVPKFENLNFITFNVLVWLLTFLALFANSLAYYFHQQIYFAERLQRRTYRHQKRLEKGNFYFSLGSVF